MLTTALRTVVDFCALDVCGILSADDIGGLSFVMTDYLTCAR
jgi:hypothetical protein